MYESTLEYRLDLDTSGRHVPTDDVQSNAILDWDEFFGSRRPRIRFILPYILCFYRSAVIIYDFSSEMIHKYLLFDFFFNKQKE